MSRLPFDDEKTEPTGPNPKPTVPRVPGVPAGSKGTGTVGTPGAVPAPVPSRTVLTVSELNATIRDLLENQLQTVWVEGEVSNARVWNTGHMYFTLKDVSSCLSCVMWWQWVLRASPDRSAQVLRHPV